MRCGYGLFLSRRSEERRGGVRRGEERRGEERRGEEIGWIRGLQLMGKGLNA
jgi:hypothetical protein